MICVQFSIRCHRLACELKHPNSEKEGTLHRQYVYVFLFALGSWISFLDNKNRMQNSIAEYKTIFIYNPFLYKYAPFELFHRISQKI